MAREISMCRPLPNWKNRRAGFFFSISSHIHFNYFKFYRSFILNWKKNLNTFSTIISYHKSILFWTLFLCVIFKYTILIVIICKYKYYKLKRVYFIFKNMKELGLGIFFNEHSTFHNDIPPPPTNYLIIFLHRDWYFELFLCSGNFLFFILDFSRF